MTYPEFSAAWGPGTRYADADPDRLATTPFSPRFLEFLAIEGYASYGEGALWTVDPAWLAPVLSAWGPETTGKHAFARTANGAIYYWDGQFARVLRPHRAEWIGVGSSMDRIMTRTFIDPSYRKNVLLTPTIRQLSRRLGPLQWDEMYTYVPALALGGPGTPESMQRVKLVEQHLLLAQLQPLAVRLV